MFEVLEMRLKDESSGRREQSIHFIYILTGVCHSHEISGEQEQSFVLFMLNPINTQDVLIGTC